MKQGPRPGGNKAAKLARPDTVHTTGATLGPFVGAAGSAKEPGRLVELHGATTAGHLWRGGSLRDRIIR